MQLVVDAIGKIYANGVRALEDVSFTLHPGVFGLMGPNGAGKSTLMNIIATLQAQDRGRVMINGLDTVKQRDKVRGLLGYLPQDFGVPSGVSALDLLDHVARLKGLSQPRERKTRVRSVLERVNLTHVAHRAVSSYSGGMRQRFGLAQALIGTPKLLIIDEPTAGLDPAERLRLHALINDVARDTIVILSTHIIEDIGALCETVGIISGGRLSATGRPRELVAELDGQLWSARLPRSEARAWSQREMTLCIRPYSETWLVTVRADASPSAEFERCTPSLEDIYFAHVKSDFAA